MNEYINKIKFCRFVFSLQKDWLKHRGGHPPIPPRTRAAISVATVHWISHVLLLPIQHGMQSLASYPYCPRNSTLLLLPLSYDTEMDPLWFLLLCINNTQFKAYSGCILWLQRDWEIKYLGLHCGGWGGEKGEIPKFKDGVQMLDPVFGETQ